MSRAPIFVVVERGRLVPADAYAAEQIAQLQDGQQFNARLSRITAKGREEREGMRGLWWAGCNLLAENSDNAALDTSRKVHEAVLMGLGFVRPRFRVDGRFDMVPVSTSDSEMDDEEFAVLQEKARAYAVERWGFDPWQQWQDEQDAKNGGRR